MKVGENQQIVVRLVEQQDALWRKFAAHTNEMFMNKKGRSLFPNLEYHIEGLDANKMYALNIAFHRIDDFRYEFKDGKWVTNGKSAVASAFVNNSARMICHTDNVKMGKQWMESTVYFDHVKITTDPGHRSTSQIFLHSMHKYIPVLSIYESPYAFVVPNLVLKPIAVIKIDHTEFMAVKKYQNETMVKMKSIHNPLYRKHPDWFSNLNQQSLSLSQSEDSPQPKRKKLEVPKQQFPAILPFPIMLPPPHFMRNPFLPADNFHYPQLDAAMMNMTSKPFPNSILSFEFLNLAYLNANMLSGVPPGSNMFPIISSSTTNSEKNDNLKP